VFSALFIAGLLHVVRRQATVRQLRTQKRLETQNLELARLREQAESAERAKSAMLVNASHEIRTPMNAIIGMTSLLEQADLPNEAAQQLATIRTSGQHLLTLINGILDLSRLEAHRFELASIPMRIEACVRDSASW
jgi:signal transduction histidine kinase